MRIAVTGAGGRLGGQIVGLPPADRTHQVVALTRLPGRLDNAAVVAADYENLAALRAALRGVETLVFVSSDGEVAHVIRHHENIIQAAVDVGVHHIVALSGLDADLASPFCYAISYGHTEQLLRASGCSFSIARASLYTEFIARWLSRARSTGQIRLPAGAGRISLLSRADVGRCLAALAIGEPTGRHHDLTGPESLDLTAIAAVAEFEWGTPVKYADLTPVAFCQEMADEGEDPWWAYAFSTMFASVREQRWSALSDEVFRLTGSAPTPFREVLARGPR